MLRKLIATVIFMTFTFTIYSQEAKETIEVKEEPPKPIISGYVDVYYRFNLNNPKKDLYFFNNYTSFTNSHNSFELGMASVKLEHNLGKAGVVADIGFGKKAEDFSYNDKNTKLAVKQAYLTYLLKENVKVTAGSWATHIGYEVVDPYLNRNYSMSYMFSYGPFFHTGVKADITLGKSGFMLGIANPTDLKSANFSRKNFIAQYSFSTKDAKYKAYINYQGGRLTDSSKMQQLDLVTNTILTDQFTVGFNGTIAYNKFKENGKYGSFEQWWGSALYLNFDPIKSLGFTLRTEYFNDSKAVCAAAFDTDIWATTLSANFRISNLIFIPELRWDRSGKEIFINNSGGAINSTVTALMAAVYKF